MSSMNTCVAYLANGNPCRYSKKPNSDYCGVHGRRAGQPPNDQKESKAAEAKVEAKDPQPEQVGHHVVSDHKAEAKAEGKNQCIAYTTKRGRSDWQQDRCKRTVAGQPAETAMCPYHARYRDHHAYRAARINESINARIASGLPVHSPAQEAKRVQLPDGSRRIVPFNSVVGGGLMHRCTYHIATRDARGNLQTIRCHTLIVSDDPQNAICPDHRESMERDRERLNAMRARIDANERANGRPPQQMYQCTHLPCLRMVVSNDPENVLCARHRRERDERQRIESGLLPLSDDRSRTILNFISREVDQRDHVMDDNEFNELIRQAEQLSFEHKQPEPAPRRAGAGAGDPHKKNMRTLREADCHICAEENKRMVMLFCCRNEMCAECMLKIRTMQCPFCKHENLMQVE